MTPDEIERLPESELLALMAKHGLEATRTPFEPTWESGNEVERIRGDRHEADLARWRRALAERIAEKATARNVLYDRLVEAGAGGLASALDWDAMPRRNVWIFPGIGFAFVGVIALGFALSALLPLVLALAAGVDTTALRFFVQLLWGPATAALILPLAMGVLQTWRRAKSKFPELALFGGRKPILYLRRFGNENPDVEDDAPMRIGPLGLVAIKRNDGLEDAAAMALRKVGPLVCLGDPRMQRRTSLAGRFIAKDALWREAIESIVEWANVVFIHYERGGSVEWEIERFVGEKARPLLIWIEDISWRNPDNSDYLDAFPPALAARLRAAGVNAQQLGPAYEGGFLFALADGKIAWLRLSGARKELQVGIRKLVRQVGIKHVSQTRVRPNLGTLRFAVNASPTLVALAAPVLAAVVAWGVVQQHIDTEHQTQAAESARVAEITRPVEALMEQAEQQSPGDALQTYARALEIMPSAPEAAHLRGQILGHVCLLRAKLESDVAVAQGACEAAAAVSVEDDLILVRGLALLDLRRGDAQAAVDRLAPFERGCRRWMTPVQSLSGELDEEFLAELRAMQREILPSCVPTYYELGYALVSAGDETGRPLIASAESFEPDIARRYEYILPPLPTPVVAQ